MNRRRQVKGTSGEGGFTLVELIMAIAITGVIVGSLAGGLMVSLRTVDATSTRYQGSNDAQLLSIWLSPDIQSASSNVVTNPPTTNNTECSGVPNVLRLRWTETQGVTTTYIAAYAVQTVAGSTKRLVRYFCTNGGAAVTHVVARNLSNSTAPTTAVTGNKISMTLTAAATPTDPTAYTFTVSGTRRSP